MRTPSEEKLLDMVVARPNTVTMAVAEESALARDQLDAQHKVKYAFHDGRRSALSAEREWLVALLKESSR